MKRLIALFLLLPLVAFGQLMPIQRNFFTTNVSPVVTVAAGSNVTVQATTTFNTRTFTVNGQTDTNVVSILATNAASGAPIYGSNVVGAVAQATHATNADNATYVTTAQLTNQVYATNIVAGGGLSLNSSNYLATVGSTNFVGNGSGLTNIPQTAIATGAYWSTNPAAASSISNAMNVASKTLTLRSPVDADALAMIDFYAGSTGDYRRYLRWNTYTNSLTGYIGFNAYNAAIWYKDFGGRDNDAYHVLSAAGTNQGGVTWLNSAEAVYINYESTKTGTSGLSVWDGAPAGSNTRYGAIDSAGVQGLHGRPVMSYRNNDSDYVKIFASGGGSGYLTTTLPLLLQSSVDDVRIVDAAYNNNIMIGAGSGSISAKGTITATNGFVSPASNYLATVVSSNLVLQSTTVANLPTPAANTFPIMYASDVLTTRGTGGYVRWDGAVWRTWESVVATSDEPTFLLNSYNARLMGNGDMSIVSFFSTPQNPWPWLYTTSGSGLYSYTASSSFPAQRTPLWYLSTGTTAGSLSMGANTVVQGTPVNKSFIGGRVGMNNTFCDSTNSYYAWFGFGNSLTAYPTDGAYFMLDTWSNKVTGVACSNEWICVTASSSTYTYADSGLQASVGAGNFNDRLGVSLEGTKVRFFTNGVLAATMTSNLPTNSITMYFNAGINKVGTGPQAILYFNAVGQHHRRNTAEAL